MSTDTFTARLYGPATSVGRELWNACANPDGAADPHPFTRYEFFEAAEESGSAVARTGWRPCHMAVERGGKTLGLMPLYLKSHSQGEYVFDQAWADAFERAGGAYYPKLQVCVPFTPVTGPRFLIAHEAPVAETRAALLAAGATAVEELNASSLHITFLTEEEWEAAGETGYLQRTDQQFHWDNRGYGSFDEFLGELSSSKRKNLRKERAAVREAGVEFDWLTGADITEAHWDQFFTFYMDTGSRKWGRPYLNRGFFSLIGETMADDILLVMARREGHYIAGAINFIGGGRLYGRHWGCIEDHPFLHFEVCYHQAIEFAIMNGLRVVEAGAQGEHKLARGYVPVTTHSAHYIAHEGFRNAVRDYLDHERREVELIHDTLEDHSPYRHE